MDGHPLRRRSDSLEVMVGRIDARTEAIIDHLERLDGRLGRAEIRLGAIESQGAHQAGVTQERGRWTGAMAVFAQKVVPTGGGLAGLLALWQAVHGGPK